MLQSIAFAMISALGTLLGFHSLYLNPKAHLNRIFFALCTSLCIWALGLTVSAADINTSLIWRCIASIGRIPFYSILLHFFVVFSGKQALLKKWWVYAAVYGPATLLLIFALSFNQFALTNTDLTRVNATTNTVWNWLFIGYSLIYCLLCVLMVWHWANRSSAAHAKKQAWLIIASFLFALTAGLATSIIGRFITDAPQLTPLYTAIPMLAIFFCICKYAPPAPCRYEDNDIIDDRIRRKVFNVVFIISVASAILNTVSQYLFDANPNLIAVLTFSLLLLAFGLIVLLVQRLHIRPHIKDIINTAVFALMVPLVTLSFLNFGGVTVWAVPFVFIIIAIVLNRRFMFNVIIVSFVFTQVALWVLRPEVRLTIGDAHYVARIGLFLIAAWMAFYVNKVFSINACKSFLQTKTQKLISDISTDFINVCESNLSKKTSDLLAKTGAFFGFDHTCLYIFDLTQYSINAAYHWHASDSTPKTAPVSLDACCWITDHMRSKEPLLIKDTEELPQNQRSQLHALFGRETRACAVIPVTVLGEVAGFFAACRSGEANAWNDHQIHTLKLLSNILAGAIAKVNQEKEINRMAFYDYLTGLPNRLLFNDRLSQAIELAKRTGNALAVMFFDLDSFKSINDTMGHQGGDALLVKVGEVLQQYVRKTDTVSRFGGDDFLILINHMTAVKDTLIVAQKMMDVFNSPFTINGQRYFVSASAGVAVYPSDGEDAETLIRNADIAMLKAKEKGKNRVELCSPDMKEEALLKMKLTNSLYRALERNEFFLHYQPQIDLKAQKVIGVEALIRWQHPEIGLIGPGLFIPLAEHTGLIGPIGEWVLRTACRQNKAWQTMGLPPIRMAVNISVNQLRHPNFVSQVKDILLETELDPEYIEFELTESAATSECVDITDVLCALKKLGVSISIDDFGTEYSSLNRLKTLPIDRIKMDIQFVRGINGTRKDKAIANVIINLAQNLDLKIIAEGVENEQQLKFLSQHMCDEVQGFFFYRPLSAEDVEALLRGLPPADY